MALALRLGKRLDELGTMTAQEFFLWRAFDLKSPISDVRHDVLAAIVAAAPLQAAGAKVSAMDMLPPWAKSAEEPEEEAEEDKAETFFAYLRGRSAITAAQDVNNSAQPERDA